MTSVSMELSDAAPFVAGLLVLAFTLVARYWRKEKGS